MGGAGLERWGLLDKFGALVAELKPEVVTMENVPRLTGRSVFRRFLSVLGEAGYQYTHSVVRCAAYGVPQTRSRLVLLASQLGRIDLAAPTHPDSGWVTVRDTIGHLVSLPAGGADKSDPLHKASGLSEKNLRRIRAAKVGGTWRDWDEALRAPCHTRTSDRTYPGVYGRMEWDRPAPTISPPSSMALGTDVSAIPTRIALFPFGRGRCFRPSRRITRSFLKGQS